MNTLSSQRSRPKGLLRLLFKLPVYLYHLHLGWLLGYRFLMLTHQGRNTGRIRYTVLEVVRHDKTSGENIVVSAYGEKADWFRNILVKPALEIKIGRERYVPIQRVLTAEERYDEFSDYERRHPSAARILAKALGFPYDGSESGRRKLAAHLPMVSLTPRGSASSSTH